MLCYYISYESVGPSSSLGKPIVTVKELIKGYNMSDMTHEEILNTLKEARIKAEKTRSDIEKAVKRIPKMLLRNKDGFVKAGHDMINDIETMIRVAESHEDRLKQVEQTILDLAMK